MRNNPQQHVHATTCISVCKRTQHVTSNNVVSVCTGLKLQLATTALMLSFHPRNLTIPKKVTRSWACDRLKTGNWSAENLSLRWVAPEFPKRSCDSGQQIPYFDSCQLITTWMCNSKLLTPTLTSESAFHIGYPVLRTYDHVSTNKFIVCSN